MPVYELYALKYAERDAQRDPLVMQRYPAIKSLEGIGVRLDAEPSK